MILYRCVLLKNNTECFIWEENTFLYGGFYYTVSLPLSFFHADFCRGKMGREGRSRAVWGAGKYEENGSLHKGWLFINEAWYYLDPTTGNMKDGWIFDKGIWYFLKTGEDPEIGLKYYRVTYKDGWPHLNNSLSNKHDGSPITALHSFRWIE